MIHHANDQFDFSQLSLSSPTVLQGGSFFSRINVSSKEDALYVYTPKCTTKQGVVQSGQKQYIDFVCTYSNTNLINWINSLEERIQNLIYEKRNTWFVTDSIELDDIQTAFIPMMKVKNSQHIIRAYIQDKVKESIQVYDEYEMPIPLSSIKETSELISILTISGIKFNQKCFQVVVNVKQIMVLEKRTFSNCMIKLKETLTPVEVKTDTLDVISIKTPSEVYKSALEKAKRSAEEAEMARLAAEKIKNTYEME
jgi:hypothetical protein